MLHSAKGGDGAMTYLVYPIRFGDRSSQGRRRQAQKTDWSVRYKSSLNCFVYIHCGDIEAAEDRPGGLSD